MRKKIHLFILGLIFINLCIAQDVTFTFANPQTTNDGTDDFYEVDVLAESTASFKMGAGLLYFNYNTAAFGNSIFTNGNIEITYSNSSTPNYLLGSEAFPGFGFYTSFVTNDNTTSRVAFSWQQALSSGMIPTNNVTGTAKELFHLKIRYVDVSQDPLMCFESSAIFTDQTFTACGGVTFADCVGNPGVQITNDNFDCSGASLSLPVELTSFSARKSGNEVLLEWETAMERDNWGFEVQRLDRENDQWEVIGFEEGIGTTNSSQSYSHYDPTPQSGLNYYRLKQVDFDGDFDLSEVRSVALESATAAQGIKIYPNPANNFINIETQAEDFGIEVFNALGQRMINTENVRTLDINRFPPGTYYFKIYDRGSNRYECTNIEVIKL